MQSRASATCPTTVDTSDGEVAETLRALREDGYDGFFSLEMNASSPTIEVRRNNQLLCQFRLDTANARNENDVLMIGDLRCTPDTLADSNSTIQSAG